MAKEEAPAFLDVGGREVRVSHPSKLYFKSAHVTKMDLVRYYLAVSEGALQGIAGRPIVLKRFVNGAENEPFYQKRAPEARPAWLRTCVLRFPSGRTAEEVVVDDAAGLVWVVNLGCIELHPHAVRAADLDHPDELRVDLDPCPGVEWKDVRAVALVVKEVLDELGLVGWPKTSGSRGLHVNCRIEQRWGFDQVRRAALALSREVERRAPSIATSKWWKEERHGVFLDYNQNAKDRTTCSAFSIRPLPDARVSAPLAWSEVAACEPQDFTIKTMPERFARVGNLHAGMDEARGSLEKLLAIADRDDFAGLGDAPWPPHSTGGRSTSKIPRAPDETAREALHHSPDQRGTRDYDKRTGEAPRVAPSRMKGAKPAAFAAKSGRRPTMPLVIVARAKKKADALEGLERWKARHPEAAKLLAADDILIDAMRGRFSAWYRIRINLRHVPEAERPAQETPDPDEDMSVDWHR